MRILNGQFGLWLKKSSILLLVFSLAIWQWLIPFQSALAFDTSKANYLQNKYYNGIISDGDFLALDAMSVADIQNFLASQGSGLASFSENGRSAAQIIWDAAHGHGGASGSWNGITINSSTGTVSPRALLVTLQKEQSLITASSPTSNQLDCAMGYENGQGCQWMYANRPQWRGFTNQVENGAWQLRYNYEIARTKPSLTAYKVGQTVTLTDPSGAYAVTIANAATSALYRYTPHVFNGNYNFWWRYTNWFGFSYVGIGAPAYNDTSFTEVLTYNSSVRIKGVRVSGATVSLGGKGAVYPDANSWEMEFEPSVGRHNYNFTYSNGDVKTITVQRHRTADINGDGRVDLQDISILSDFWYTSSPSNPFANLNPDIDDVVDILDLSIMANHWEG